eukprot:3686296-Pleurochrysis_carterae.AAC.2
MATELGCNRGAAQRVRNAALSIMRKKRHLGPIKRVILENRRTKPTAEAGFQEKAGQANQIVVVTQLVHASQGTASAGGQQCATRVTSAAAKCVIAAAARAEVHASKHARTAGASSGRSPWRQRSCTFRAAARLSELPAPAHARAHRSETSDGPGPSAASTAKKQLPARLRSSCLHG